MGDKERTLDGSGPPTFSTMLGSAEMPTSAGTHGHPSNHSSASYSIESPEAPGRAGAKRAGPASGHGECRAGPGLPPVARLRPAPGPPPASPCPALGPTPARRAAGPPGSSAGGPAPRVRPPVPPGAPAPTPAPPLPLRAEHPTWGARGTAGPEGPSPGLQRVGSLPVDARAGRPAKSPTVDMITGMSGMGFYSPAGGVAGAAASEPPGRPPQPWGPSPWPSASPAGGSQPSQGGVFGSQLEMCSDTTLHTSGSGGFGSFSQGCHPGGLVPAARGPAPAPPGGTPEKPRSVPAPRLPAADATREAVEAARAAPGEGFLGFGQPDSGGDLARSQSFSLGGVFTPRRLLLDDSAPVPCPAAPAGEEPRGPPGRLEARLREELSEGLRAASWAGLTSLPGGGGGGGGEDGSFLACRNRLRGLAAGVPAADGGPAARRRAPPRRRKGLPGPPCGPGGAPPGAPSPGARTPGAQTPGMHTPVRPRRGLGDRTPSVSEDEGGRERAFREHLDRNRSLSSPVGLCTPELEERPVGLLLNGDAKNGCTKLFRPKRPGGSKLLLLIRHGESEYNLASKRLAGGVDDPLIFDPDLTQAGRHQCRSLREVLQRDPELRGQDVCWVVSPLARAIQTFLIACPGLEALREGHRALRTWPEGDNTCAAYRENALRGVPAGGGAPPGAHGCCVLPGAPAAGEAALRGRGAGGSKRWQAQAARDPSQAGLAQFGFGRPGGSPAEAAGGAAVQHCGMTPLVEGVALGSPPPRRAAFGSFFQEAAGTPPAAAAAGPARACPGPGDPLPERAKARRVSMQCTPGGPPAADRAFSPPAHRRQGSAGIESVADLGAALARECPELSARAPPGGAGGASGYSTPVNTRSRAGSLKEEWGGGGGNPEATRGVSQGEEEGEGPGGRKGVTCYLHEMVSEQLVTPGDVGRPREVLRDHFGDVLPAGSLDSVGDGMWWHTGAGSRHGAAGERLSCALHKHLGRRESKEEFNARVGHFVDWALSRPERVVAVVGHSVFIRQVMRKLGQPDAPSLRNADYHKVHM